MDINEMVDKEKAELRESLRLDAQRYRKLKEAFQKAEESDFPMQETQMLSTRLGVDFDSAVDALPDPKENSGLVICKRCRRRFAPGTGHSC